MTKTKTALKRPELHDIGNVLCSAGRAGAGVQVTLVDERLETLTAGTLPSRPLASFRGKLGERCELNAAAGRFIVVGCGTATEDPAFWEAAGAAVIDSLRALKIERAVLAGELLAKKPDAAAARAFAIGAGLAGFRNVRYRKEPPKDHFEVGALGLPPATWKASAEGRQMADAVNWTRALVDAPANLLTPKTLATEIRSLEALGVEVQVLDAKALEQIGAGGLLAVGGGSAHAPCMVVCCWRGGKGKGYDLGLVGKGLTFDAGGLNLKPWPGISKMKQDMAGAAAVAGALRVMATRKAKVNVVAALPLCENVIDATSYRPGDVITSLSGLTIEVDNTDAEGRIVLADGISYLVDKYRPRLLVDLATLTGNIVATLHEEYAGLFTADESLATALMQAGEGQGEELWRMPLTKKQDYLVESDIADVKNVGAPGAYGAGMGSAVAGAKFLERFAKGARWAHLDIAGTAWSSRPKPGIPKGATGFGVRLLDSLVDRLPS